MDVLLYKKAKKNNNVNDTTDESPTTRRHVLLMKAAKALSYNPSRMTSKLVDEIEEAASSSTNPVVPAAETMVELVSFLATIQALHRVEMYYQVSDEGRGK